MNSDQRELIARTLYERHPAHWGHEPPEGEPADGTVSWRRARHNGVCESEWYADADAVLEALRRNYPG